MDASSGRCSTGIPRTGSGISILSALVSRSNGSAAISHSARRLLSASPREVEPCPAPSAPGKSATPKASHPVFRRRVRHARGLGRAPRGATWRTGRAERKNAVAGVGATQALGLGSRGAGADNIRNAPGPRTAGIDPQELIDTRAYAREWHFHILNERTLYGLPRKFNVAFDGAGVIPVLEDTNDIGFQAVEVADGFGLAPGVWFRLALGG